MRLLYVADGRSPISLNWMRHFVESGHEVHLISTYPCRPDLALDSLIVIPVAFTGVLRPSTRRSGGAEDCIEGDRSSVEAVSGARSAGTERVLGSGTIGLRMVLRHWLGPLTLGSAARRARAAMHDLQPHLVHAMRIPFEGMLATAADPAAPVLLSVWGNDFTLHAPASPAMRRFTRLALRRAGALHTDCRRDRRLAGEWGFQEGLPSIVLPGNGGVRPDIFGTEPGAPSSGSPLGRALESIPASAPVVINPRGFRGYVRNDTFFKSIPLVLVEHPEAIFICPAMAGERQAERWVSRLGIGEAVRLLPKLGPADMAAAYRRAWVMVSPSEHDGTPNTLLESMACGALPIAGDLESIREWIQPAQNGLLIDPADPEALAGAISLALRDDQLRSRAKQRNGELVAERASYPKVMAEAESLYRSLIG